MKQRQGGFTLIELVMVIVILGILAAVAIPKFIDLSGDANTAVTKMNSGDTLQQNSLTSGPCTMSPKPTGCPN